jgi:hypothetical protein
MFGNVLETAARGRHLLVCRTATGGQKYDHHADLTAAWTWPEVVIMIVVGWTSCNLASAWKEPARYGLHISKSSMFVSLW